MKATIETSRYEFSNGQKPRGQGHWGFIPSDKLSRQDYLDFIFWVPGLQTFGEAKKVAASHFGALGVYRVSVCP